MRGQRESRLVPTHLAIRKRPWIVIGTYWTREDVILPRKYHKYKLNIDIEMSDTCSQDLNVVIQLISILGCTFLVGGITVDAKAL